MVYTQNILLRTLYTYWTDFNGMKKYIDMYSMYNARDEFYKMKSNLNLNLSKVVFMLEKGVFQLHIQTFSTA